MDSVKFKSINKRDTTAVKGIAILAVIISHLPRIIDFPGVIENMLHPLGYTGVAVFLTLSGYGLVMSAYVHGGYHIWDFGNEDYIKFFYPFFLAYGF